MTLARSLQKVAKEQNRQQKIAFLFGRSNEINTSIQTFRQEVIRSGKGTQSPKRLHFFFQNPLK